MPQYLVDRYHPQLRRKQQAFIDAGQLCKLDELALLEPEQLRPLVQLSLLLLLLSGIFFVLLDQVAYSWRTHIFLPHVTIGSIVVWLGINILGYIIVLPIHEAIHGLAFVFGVASLTLVQNCHLPFIVERSSSYFVVTTIWLSAWPRLS